MIARPLTGRSVLLIFIGFFGVIFLANGIMMVIAALSYDGVVESDAYRKGRDYNRVLEAAREQEALGWLVSFGEEPAMDGSRRVRAEFSNGAGGAIDDLDVRMTYFSPVEEDEDRTLTLSPEGEGHYGGSVSLPRPGRYRLRLEAFEGEAVVYRLEREIMVTP